MASRTRPIGRLPAARRQVPSRQPARPRVFFGVTARPGPSRRGGGAFKIARDSDARGGGAGAGAGAAGPSESREGGRGPAPSVALRLDSERLGRAALAGAGHAPSLAEVWPPPAPAGRLGPASRHGLGMGAGGGGCPCRGAAGLTQTARRYGGPSVPRSLYAQARPRQPVRVRVCASYGPRGADARRSRRGQRTGFAGSSLVSPGDCPYAPANKESHSLADPRAASAVWPAAQHRARDPAGPHRRCRPAGPAGYFGGPGPNLLQSSCAGPLAPRGPRTRLRTRTAGP
jgi:hypothetical protein